MSYFKISGNLEKFLLDPFWPEQNGCHFVDDIFKYISLEENFNISLAKAELKVYQSFLRLQRYFSQSCSFEISVKFISIV